MDITKSIGGGLHLLVVLISGEFTLGHRVELVTEEDSVGSLVDLREGFDGDQDLVGSLLRHDGNAEDVVRI